MIIADAEQISGVFLTKLGLLNVNIKTLDVSMDAYIYMYIDILQMKLILPLFYIERLVKRVMPMLSSSQGINSQPVCFYRFQNKRNNRDWL